MPNWCANYIQVSHSAPIMIENFIKAGVDKSLFNFFVPMPEELKETNPSSDRSAVENDILLEKFGATNWYDWSITNWGTKWDISGGHFTSSTDNDISGSFETAWAPPIAFYNTLTEMGFEIDAVFIETGMCFAGRYTSENGESYYEYNFANENWRDDIDDKIIVDMLENEYENYMNYIEENIP